MFKNVLLTRLDFLGLSKLESFGTFTSLILAELGFSTAGRESNEIKMSSL